MTVETKRTDHGWRVLFICAGLGLFLPALVSTRAFYSMIAFESILGAMIAAGWYVNRTRGAAWALGAASVVFIVLVSLCIAFEIPLPTASE